MNSSDRSPSAQPLEKPLGYQPFNIPMSNIILAVLRQIDGAVLGLDLSRIFQNPHIDEEILRRLETARQIDVCPLAFITGQKIVVLPKVLFFFRTQAALICVAICLALYRLPLLLLMVLLFEYVLALPAHSLQLLCTYTMVCQETSFVALHGKMVNKQGACCRLVFIGIEAALEWLKDTRHISVKVSDLSCHRSNKFGLIWRKMGEVFGSFGMLYLMQMCKSCRSLADKEFECPTNLFPSSPCIEVNQHSSDKNTCTHLGEFVLECWRAPRLINRVSRLQF